MWLMLWRERWHTGPPSLGGQLRKNVFVACLQACDNFSWNLCNMNGLDSSVNTGTRLRVGRLGGFWVWVRARVRGFSVSEIYHTVPVTNPVLYENMRQKCEAGHSVLSAVKVRNAWSYAPPSSHVFWSRRVYSHAPHNDVSVNDGPHIRQWSRKIIIL